MQMIMMANDKPIITIVNEKPVVTSARVCDCSRMTLDNRPPVDDATIRVTTGNSQTAVILEMA